MNGGTDWKGTLKDTLTERAQLDYIGTRGAGACGGSSRASRPGDLFRTPAELEELRDAEPVRPRKKTARSPWDIKRSIN